jgi:hypothetical protein
VTVALWLMEFAVMFEQSCLSRLTEKDSNFKISLGSVNIKKIKIEQNQIMFLVPCKVD